MLLLRSLILVALFAGFSYAADVQGILLDAQCSPRLTADQKAALQHTRECALMPDCIKSGYVVLMADGTVVKLDAAGNDKAVQALKASKQKDQMRVLVTGERTGNTMKATAVKLL